MTRGGVCVGGGEWRHGGGIISILARGGACGDWRGYPHTHKGTREGVLGELQELTTCS